MRIYTEIILNDGKKIEFVENTIKEMIDQLQQWKEEQDIGQEKVEQKKYGRYFDKRNAIELYGDENTSVSWTDYDPY